MDDVEYTAIQESIKLMESHLKEPGKNYETITQILPNILNQGGTESLEFIESLINELPQDLQIKIKESLQVGGYQFDLVNGQLKHKG